ncbi:MAG: hypothetical protein KTR31_20555 [Myxococcales bacterium]|nr:hypothetical protein [Myxococcales bacterium]
MSSFPWVLAVLAVSSTPAEACPPSNFALLSMDREQLPDCVELGGARFDDEEVPTVTFFNDCLAVFVLEGFGTVAPGESTLRLEGVARLPDVDVVPWSVGDETGTVDIAVSPARIYDCDSSGCRVAAAPLPGAVAVLVLLLGLRRQRVSATST